MIGKLIVFEGIEGCGKTTQLQRTHDWLCQQNWTQWGWPKFPRLVITREPGGTSLGQELRHLLLNNPQVEIHPQTELLLYAADRAQHVETVLKPQLAKGAIVLCDRYVDSTTAYQGYGRGLDLHLIHQLNCLATGGVVGDLTLWLDVSAEVGLARMQRRGAADRIEQADLDFHQRVEQGFRAIAQDSTREIVRVDASLPEEKVTAQIQAILSNYFDHSSLQP